MPDIEVVRLPSAQFEQFADRPAWLEGRRTRGIGSSDAAAILGVSRFKSPLALYYEKLGIRAENPRAQELRDWGLALEEPIAQRYSAITGRYVATTPPHSIARSTVHPFAIASVDRLVVGHREDAVPTPAGIGIAEIEERASVHGGRMERGEQQRAARRVPDSATASVDGHGAPVGLRSRRSSAAATSYGRTGRATRRSSRRWRSARRSFGRASRRRSRRRRTGRSPRRRSSSGSTRATPAR